MTYVLNPFTKKLDNVGSGGTPAGLDTQIIFNDSGSYAGNSLFTFDKNTETVTSPQITVKSSNTTGETLFYPGGVQV